MSKFRNASVRRDHYEELTQAIIAKLESGVLPWRKPWDASKCASASSPMNPTTGRCYQGINALALAMSSYTFSSGDPRWCSYKQAEGRGWQVRKGEKGTIVFFYKKLNIKDENQEDRTIPLLRAYTVFHASQIDGIPEFVAPEAAKPVIERIADVDLILKASGVRVEIGGDRAFYRQATDHIQMPPEQAFEDMPAWAATVIHELSHASGAKHRLDRDLTGRFGSSAYSREELRADLASLFVGNALDLPCDVPNHASYIESWVKVLKDDKREIFRAAADANRIAEWILSHHPGHAAGDDDQDATDEAQPSNGNASDEALAA
jgi:antirestriction protein ArdC